MIKLKFGSNNNNHLKAFSKSGLKRVKTFNIKKIKTIVDEQDEEYEDDSSLQKKIKKKLMINQMMKMKRKKMKTMMKIIKI